MTERAETYSDLLLGNSLNIILDATDSALPKMRESEFKLTALPLLQRPFHHVSLSAYARLVGELTNPLQVVDDQDGKTVLFEVPALIQTTGTTLPTGGAPAADVTMRAIYAEGDRGVDINPLIATFLKRITNAPDHRTAVLDPLKAILARYGLEMDINDEKDLVKLSAEELKAQQAPVATVDQGSSFTDEYE